MPLHVHRLSEAFMIPCLFPGGQAAAEKQSGVDQPVSASAAASSAWDTMAVLSAALPPCSALSVRWTALPSIPFSPRRIFPDTLRMTALPARSVRKTFRLKQLSIHSATQSYKKIPNKKTSEGRNSVKKFLPSVFVIGWLVSGEI